jgi:hypothetical protein
MHVDAGKKKLKAKLKAKLKGKASTVSAAGEGSAMAMAE